MTKRTELEDRLAEQLDAVKIPYQREFYFAKHLRRPTTGRPYMYKADFFIEPNILVEVEGGIWTGGRHTQPKGFIADIEKYNLATKIGYRLIRAHRGSIKDGSTLTDIEELLGRMAA